MSNKKESESIEQESNNTDWVEEFVEDFTSDGDLTPIDIVSEITGLTYEEIRSCSKIIRVPL